MGRVRLPSPTELTVIKGWLGDATMLHIDGVQFERPASGIRMTVHYRGLKGDTQKKTITAPDCKDFEDVVVTMERFMTSGERASVVDPVTVQ